MKLARKTHQFLSIFGIVINDRHSIEKEEDAISGDLGLGIVWGKGGRLTDGQCTEDDNYRDGKDVDKGLVQNVVSWEGDQETSEAKDDSKEEENDSRGEAIGESVDLRIYDHGIPGVCVCVCVCVCKTRKRRQSAGIVWGQEHINEEIVCLITTAIIIEVHTCKASSLQPCTVRRSCLQ